MNYTYKYGASFTFDQTKKLKEATEKHLKDDYVLNHQYAAYLIRERRDFDNARYYLDTALLEVDKTPAATAIIHSLGNLNYALYKQCMETGNTEKANDHYESAKDHFFRSRSLSKNREEHGYFTDIDMMHFRLKSGYDPDKNKSILKAESYALTIEALKVIPTERQNLLRSMLGEGTPYSELPENDKFAISEVVKNGMASPILLEYYCQDLLDRPRNKNWNRLKDIVSIYRKTSTGVNMDTVLCMISKRAFILNAITRFEILRNHYDSLVKYSTVGMNYGFLAEYVRLLTTDAFALEKYSFLRSIIEELTELFRESKPRFLNDEYILDSKYYTFDEDNEELLISLFIKNHADFYSTKMAKRYSGMINLNSAGQEKFIRIPIDLLSDFHVRAIRKEVAAHSGRFSASFNVKHAYDGLTATDFMT